MTEHSYNDILQSVTKLENMPFYDSTSFKYTKCSDHNKLKWQDYTKFLKLNIHTFKYIPIKDEYIINMSIKKDPHQIRYVMNPSIAQMKYVIWKNPYLVVELPNVPVKLKRRAIKQEPWILTVMKNATKADYEYGLKYSIDIWNYSEMKKYDLIFRAINNGSAELIRRVPDQTEYLCLVAYLNNPSALQYIKPKFKYVKNAIVEHMPKSNRSISWTPKKIKHIRYSRMDA